MTMSRLFKNSSGAGAAEFALVLPLLVLLLFGIIDAGRLLYETNRAEKATQFGARYAIVTDVIPPQLVAADYTGVAGCSERSATGNVCETGDFVDLPAALGTLTCTRTSCTCTGTCPSNAAIPTAAFDNLVNRMRTMKSDITADRVRVDFKGSGLGFAGDPNGMDVVPIVTVRLVNMQFRPVALLGAVPFTLPPFATTLTAEDSAGVLAN